MRNIRRWIPALATAALCRIYYLFASELYMYTDNVGVALVLDGFYAEPYSQYQHPFLCRIVYLLARIFPWADMYTVLIHALLFC